MLDDKTVKTFSKLVKKLDAHLTQNKQNHMSKVELDKFRNNRYNNKEED